MRFARACGRFGVLMKSKRGGAITHEVSRLKGFRSVGKPAKPADDLPFTVPEVAAEIRCWLSHLSAERRMSTKTVDAYGRDVRQFLDFLALHFGDRATLATLRNL